MTLEYIIKDTEERSGKLRRISDKMYEEVDSELAHRAKFYITLYQHTTGSF